MSVIAIESAQHFAVFGGTMSPVASKKPSQSIAITLILFQNIN